MTVSGAKLREIVLISGPLIATIILPIIVQPYKLNRLLAFLSPTGVPGKRIFKYSIEKNTVCIRALGQGLTFDLKSYLSFILILFLLLSHIPLVGLQVSCL